MKTMNLPWWFQKKGFHIFWHNPPNMVTGIVSRESLEKFCHERECIYIKEQLWAIREGLATKLRTIREGK